MKEICEYKGRRSSKKPPVSSKPNYLKKISKQTFVSILLFSIIFSNNLFKTDFTAKIQTFTKTALEYEIDLSAVSDSIKNLLKNNVPASSQGEVKNEISTNPQKSL